MSKEESRRTLDLSKTIPSLLCLANSLAKGVQSISLARYETDELCVSTIIPMDVELPETAVSHHDYNEGKWIIVEQYTNEKAALEGHARWVSIMTSDVLPDSLTDVDIFGLNLEPFRRQREQ